MSVVVVTPPSGLVVSLAEAKTQLRVTGTNNDDLITALIQAATAHLDGPDGWLGRSLLTQTLEARFDNFWNGCAVSRHACRFELPCGPIQSITSVKYDDGAGVEQTLTSDYYRQIGGTFAGIELAYGKSWPTARYQSEAVRVRYAAGYGDAAAVPAPIKQAIHLAIRHLYSLGERSLFQSELMIEGVGRKNWIVTDVSAQIIETATVSLLRPYRVLQ